MRHLKPLPENDWPTFDRPEWHQEANCRGMGTDLFFPRQGTSIYQIAAAKEVCENCPVRSQCEAVGHAYPHHSTGGVGIWGGFTQKELYLRRNGHRRAQ